MDAIALKIAVHLSHLCEMLNQGFDASISRNPKYMLNQRKDGDDMPPTTRNRRDARIIAEYLAGKGLRKLEAEFEISQPAIRKILIKASVYGYAGEGKRRHAKYIDSVRRTDTEVVAEPESDTAAAMPPPEPPKPRYYAKVNFTESFVAGWDKKGRPCYDEKRHEEYALIYGNWAYIRADKKKNVSGKRFAIIERYTSRPDGMPEDIDAAILAKLGL